MKNTFIIDERVIPSHDVREFITDIGWKFTDREIASMIYNNPINSYTHNLNVLKNMIEEFDDESIISEINERISFVDDCIECIKSNTDNCIFKLVPYMYEDELGFNNPYRHYPILFSKFDDAYEYAKLMKPKYGYDIIKSRVCSSINDAKNHRKHDDDYDIQSDIAKIEFDLDHDISDYYIEKKIKYDIFKNKYHDILNANNHRFEYFYVLIPHPFKTGDIVFDISTDLIGVLYTLYDWNVFKDIPVDERPSKTRNYNFDAARLIMESLDNGEFAHSHPLITAIRYVNDDDYESKDEKDIYMKESINAKIRS